MFITKKGSLYDRPQKTLVNAWKTTKDTLLRPFDEYSFRVLMPKIPLIFISSKYTQSFLQELRILS